MNLVVQKSSTAMVRFSFLESMILAGPQADISISPEELIISHEANRTCDTIFVIKFDHWNITGPNFKVPELLNIDGSVLLIKYILSILALTSIAYSRQSITAAAFPLEQYV